MNRYCLLLSFIVLHVIPLLATGQTRCFLKQGNSLYAYDASDLQVVIEQSGAGDTLYLPEGTYSAFVLSQPVSVIGAGNDRTIISGDIRCAFDGEDVTIQGLNISGDITNTRETYGLQIRQCTVANLCFEADNHGLILDKCFVRDNIYLSPHLFNLTATHSKIYCVNAREGGFWTDDIQSTFVNCTIRNLNNFESHLHGRFQNCILKNYYKSSTLTDCEFSYSLFGFDYNLVNSTRINCYKDREFTLDASLQFNRYDNKSLADLSYLGEDGYVVGSYRYGLSVDEFPDLPSNVSVSYDIDMDGEFGLSDVECLASHLLHLPVNTPIDMLWIDVNNDGIVNICDIVALINCMEGK